LYALINDNPIPVESLKSLVAGPSGRILIAGAATSDEDCRQVQRALSQLKKKEVVTFNVVTSDWRAITGQAKIADVALISKSKSSVHFYLVMKSTKGRKE